MKLKVDMENYLLQHEMTTVKMGMGILIQLRMICKWLESIHMYMHGIHVYKIPYTIHISVPQCYIFVYNTYNMVKTIYYLLDTQPLFPNVPLLHRITIKLGWFDFILDIKRYAAHLIDNLMSIENPRLFHLQSILRRDMKICGSTKVFPGVAYAVPLQMLPFPSLAMGFVLKNEK